MDRLRFSIRVNNDLSASRFADLAVAAEEAAFDQVWLSNDLLLESALVALPVAAMRTSRIRLGTGILNPYTIHPAEMAMFHRSLDALSGGRVLLGLAAGAEDFLSWVGVERTAPLDSVRRAVGAVRYLLGSSNIRPEGWVGTSRLDGDPIPIYVGAMSPGMLSLAGTLADGALPLLLPPERYEEARTTITAAARAAGRGTDDVDVAACVWCSISDDREEAKAALAAKIAYYGPSFSAHVLGGLGLEPGDLEPSRAAIQNGDASAARSLLPSAAMRLGMAGTADDITDRCAGLIEMGAEHVSFGPPLGPRPEEAIRLLGDRVVPRLTGEGETSRQPP